MHRILQNVKVFGDTSRKEDTLQIANLINARTENTFAALDINKDGQLSRHELLSFHMRFNVQNFDINRDGLLSWEEFPSTKVSCELLLSTTTGTK